MKNVIRKTLRFCFFTLLSGLAAICIVGLAAAVYRLATKPKPDSPEALLEKADELAWLNNWVSAEPIYKQAESMFLRQHKDAQEVLSKDPD